MMQEIFNCGFYMMSKANGNKEQKNKLQSGFYPEFDEKESIVWPFVKQLFQATFLLRELVVYLPDVHGLQVGVTVARVGLSNVHKQVLVELQRQENIL